MWKLNTTFLSKQWSKKISKGKSKNKTAKPMGCCKSSSERMIITLNAYIKRIESSQTTLHLKELEKEKKISVQV